MLQKLPSRFEKYGFTYKLVVRDTYKAIYAQYVGNTLLAWEVIKIRVRPPKYNKFLKREEPAREVYPSSAQWGKWGWTITNWKNDPEGSWERALSRYYEINKKND